MVDQSLIQSRRILGIDPGVNVTGYGVLDQRANKLVIVEAGVIRGGKEELSDKVMKIYDGVKDRSNQWIRIKWRSRNFTLTMLIQ